MVEVSLDEPSGKIKVHHVWAAVDPGVVVQPKNVMAQMEGAIIFGLGAALQEGITLKNGEPQETQLRQLPRAAHVGSAADRRQGYGHRQHADRLCEASVPVVAPTIANAVARLTGKRLRAAADVARPRQTGGARRLTQTLQARPAAFHLEPAFFLPYGAG